MPIMSEHTAESAAAPHPPGVATTLLNLSDLTIVFPVDADGVRRTRVVVNHVSFALPSGATLGLMGESGSGKSTTAAAVMGMVPPPGRMVGGRIDFEGRNLVGMSERDLRRLRGSRIGYVAQDPYAALHPMWPIGDQIAESILAHHRLPRRDAWRRAVALLDVVRIPQAAQRAHDFPYQLSGGQCQRAVIAAALANRPSLLVADEPTTALDVTVQADILDLLLGLQHEHRMALLLISHDPGVIARMAHAVAVMYAGRIVEEGPVHEVLAAPLHPYTQALLASVPGNAPGRRLAAIPGVAPDPARQPTGCAFAPRCPARQSICTMAPPAVVSPAPGRLVRCVLHQEHT